MSQLEEQVREFVAGAEEYVSCPYPLMDRVREAGDPIYYSESMGAWVITRRGDAEAVLLDVETWSSHNTISSRGKDSAYDRGIAELRQDPEMAKRIDELSAKRSGGHVLVIADPEDGHWEQRMALRDIFAPKRLQEMEPFVQDTCSELVQAFSGEEVVELVSAFAVEVPTRVLTFALGLNLKMAPTIKGWGDALAVRIGRPNVSLEQVRAFIEAQIAFTEHFEPLLTQREAEPKQDMLSFVATAEVDGKPLSHAVRLEIINQLLIAGHETATTNIANIAYKLATDSALRDRLAADRQLVPAFVEEMLRSEPPVNGMYRQAKCDTSVGGMKIPRGDFVFVSYAAANRDPEACPHPSEFDIERKPNRHLSFGYGKHICLGAPLARLEGVCATNALLDLPKFRLAQDHEDQFADSFIARTRETLKVSFN